MTHTHKKLQNKADCNKCQKRNEIKYCGALVEKKIYLAMVV